MISCRAVFWVYLILLIGLEVQAQSIDFKKLELGKTHQELIQLYDSILKHDAKNTIVLSKKELTLGRIALEKENFNLAEQKFKSSIQILPKKNTSSIVNTQLLLAYQALYSLQYDVGKSIDTVVLTALEAFKIPNAHLADSSVYAKLCSDLGGMHGIKDDDIQGIEFYKKAALYEQNETQNLGLIYNNLAYAYGELGHTHLVLENYTKAHQIWVRSQPEYILNNNIVFHNLITTFIAYGDLKSAKLYLEKYHSYFHRYVNVRHQALEHLNSNDSLIHVAFDYLKSNIEYYGVTYQVDSTEKYIRLIEKLYQNSPSYQQEFFNYVFSAIEGFGFYHKKNNHFDAAEKVFKRIERYALGNFYQMKYHANLGILYYDQKKYTFSEQWIDRALTFFPKETQSLSFYMLNILKIELSSILSTSFDEVEALKNYYQQLLKLSEPIKSLEALKYDDFYPLNSSRHISILTKSGKIMESVFLKTSGPQHIKIAHNFFRIAADMFQQYYLKGYYNQDLDAIAKEINDGLLRTLNNQSVTELKQVINLLENNASQHLWRKFLDRNSNKIEDLEKNQEAYEKFNTLNFNINEFQSKIADGSVVLKYVMGEKNIHLILIDHQQIKIFTIDHLDEIKKDVIQLHQLLKDVKSSSKEIKKVSKTLREQLLDKIDLKVYQNYTFILEDFLNVLPMEVLLENEHIQSVKYGYSLSLLSIQSKMTHFAKKRKLAVFAPDYTLNNDENINRNKGLQQLIFAQREAKAIIDHLDGDLFLGEKSSKQNFLKFSKDYNLLHLAMHSVIDEQNYENSYLLFQNNEALYYKDLYEMQIPAQLVILSACNTGYGILEQGEGLMSLSRAFTYAGVSSTIHSLWEVPDKETADLMEIFYTYLKDNYRPEEALLLAKEDFQKLYPNKSHPFFWAGFIIHGDASVTPSTRFNFYWIGGILVTLILLGWWRFERKKHSRFSS